MDTFIARQPIFDLKKNVYAYELLFRSGWENYFSHDDIDQAASKVIGDSVLVHGLDTLTGGRKGFYNFSRETLLEAYYTVLPKDETVVEILEDVEPDNAVIKAAEKVKAAGYIPWRLTILFITTALNPFLIWPISSRLIFS